MRGNVVDLAVAVVIGRAFGVIIKSLVADVIMPPIGLLLGNVDFANLFSVIKVGSEPGPYGTLADARAVGAVTINYELWRFHYVHSEFYHRRLCYLYGNQRVKLDETQRRRSSGRTDNQGLSVLLHSYTNSGKAMSKLHFAIRIT